MGLVGYDTLVPMSVRYHVIPSQEGAWRVKRSGANRASTVHSTQSEAVEKARELAKKDDGGAVIVHRVDGTIRRSSTYGKDPYPPREHSGVKK
jgi:Uncharacterized protein conserved in bacteria (DUF2188)